MKTQVIQLDPHDDLTSVRDKMTWAKTDRILLVYPRRSRVLKRTLDLRLLQRHALFLGAQLAIVASSQDIRQSARELDIPLYKNASIAQRRTWQAPSSLQLPVRRTSPVDLRQMRAQTLPREGRWRGLLGIRLAFFTLAVVAVLALLVLYFPSATVTLTPRTRMQSQVIAFSAGAQVTAVNPSGSLPAHLVSATLDGSKTAPVTGSIITPNTPAVGLARFRNLDIARLTIPSGTVIRTTTDPAIRFATTVDGVMPAGVAQTVDIPIQAVTAGASGNLPSGSLVAIEGSLGASLAVTNPSPTTGGTDHSAPVQTADDRTRLHDALVSAILDKCQAALPKSLSQGDVYFPGTLAVGQILSETYFPADGQTGPTLSLTMKVQCQAQYAQAADISTLAGLKLDAGLPGGFEPASKVAAALTSAPPVTDARGQTTWKMTVQRLTSARIDPVATMQMIQGRSLATAAQQLSHSLQLVAAPVIKVTPAWWPWLPVFPFRIAVLVEG